MIKTNRTYPWSFVILLFRNGKPSHGGTIKLSKRWLQVNH